MRGRVHLKTLEKYYAVDMGLRRLLAGPTAADTGATLENTVFLELLRRGKDVYTGKRGDQEIDFVTVDADAMSYYQVAASVRDPGTLRRELRVLEGLRDDYPKTLLTLDDDPDTNYNGIQKLNVLDWLAKEPC